MQLSWERWFPALGERNVRIYTLGQAVSVLGTSVLDILLNLVLWEATRSPSLLGVLNFALFMPGLLVTPLFSASLTADNARRRTLWVLAAGVVVAFCLCVLSVLGALAGSVILLLAALRGVLNGMEQPSRQMLLACSVSSPDRIGGAMALNTVVFQLARMLGPVLAALLFSTAGPAWGFALTMLSLTVMIACVIRVRVIARPAAGAVPDGRDGLGGALDFLRADRFGRLFMPVMVCMAACVGGYQTLVPVLADRVFLGTARWTSSFLGATGAGALAAALLMSTHHAAAIGRWLAVPLPWVAAVALVCLGTRQQAAVALASFAVIGFAMTTAFVTTTASLHQRVPANARNGLIALTLVSFNGVMSLAQVPAGLLAERLGVQAAFCVLGGTLLCALSALYLPRWLRSGRLELDAERV